MEEATPYDAGWKLIFKVFLPDLVRMLFPAVWALVDWGAPVQERSAELLRLAPEAQTGRRYIDHLVEVQFKNGQRGELFLHFEAQSQPDPEFPKRMFIYHYRIRDYHATENLVSMAILADPDPNWRPSEYYTNLAGCELRFRFLTAKLLDLEEETLERELSPVALALLAHRKALRARGSPELTMQEKIALVRAMKARGYTHDEIIALYKVVDYFMVLPQEYEQLVQRVIHEVESEREFPLTSLERFAIMQGLQQGLEQGLQQGLEQGLQQGLQQGLEQGLQQGLQQGLEQGLQQGLQQGLKQAILDLLALRFGELPESLQARLQQVFDGETLRKLVRLAHESPSLEAFEQALHQLTHPTNGAE